LPDPTETGRVISLVIRATPPISSRSPRFRFVFVALFPQPML
jgi:hypothetical protein